MGFFAYAYFCGRRLPQKIDIRKKYIFYSSKKMQHAQTGILQQSKRNSSFLCGNKSFLFEERRWTFQLLRIRTSFGKETQCNCRWIKLKSTTCTYKLGIIQAIKCKLPWWTKDNIHMGLWREPQQSFKVQWEHIFQKKIWRASDGACSTGQYGHFTLERWNGTTQLVVMNN
jgi:hypothetical protein